ncbi:hypothetical protein WJX81_005028 [Elliptochloris bilobata]|uniref:SUN domain-containing protein n=1 Tax=Elliptochloris bilobata TaxID=381761 RepID=A0AAW1S5M2_9CHLO
MSGQQPIGAAAEGGAGEPREEERHNLALAKDGAKVVAANIEARKPGAVLDADGDTFLRNECRADKWLLLELSQVARVDTVRLAQFELYSSRVRDLKVLGRQSHPRADGSDYAKGLNASSWQPLGRFTAANVKGVQAFSIASPAWVKFLQLRFVTHYGNEPVCAINELSVFGKSAVEDLEDRLALEGDAESGGTGGGANDVQRLAAAAAETGLNAADAAAAAAARGQRARARHGGNVYDALIAEIKALKLAQKAAPRALRDLRADFEAAVSGLSSELADLRRKVAAAAEAAAVAAADAAEAAAAAAGRVLLWNFAERACSWEYFCRDIE